GHDTGAYNIHGHQVMITITLGCRWVALRFFGLNRNWPSKFLPAPWSIFPFDSWICAIPPHVTLEVCSCSIDPTRWRRQVNQSWTVKHDRDVFRLEGWKGLVSARLGRATR